VTTDRAVHVALATGLLNLLFNVSLKYVGYNNCLIVSWSVVWDYDSNSFNREHRL